MIITLKDGRKKEYAAGTTAAQVAADLSAGLARVALAAEVDGELCGLDAPINADAQLSILTFDDKGGKKAYWHTASHVLAQAVKRLYPAVKLTIGPAIESGFYYDFDSEQPFLPEDLENLEAEMKRIIKEDLRLERYTLPRDEALAFARQLGEPYKVELISELPDGEDISFYRQGEFTDLCAGPHIPGTGRLKAIKLLSATGAYWRGDAKNKMLQRIYGIAFPKSAELDEYLARIEEAKKRDHRKLGRELDLFDIYEEGPGFPFLFPRGMIIRNELEAYWREIHQQAGYHEIKSPIILSEELWHRSGHWDHYKDNMYFTKIDEGDYAIKPMNCPGAMLVYKRRLMSYRDLPLRMGELGLVHRHELSGALHGMMRVRSFTQDDAHIFMTQAHVKDELRGVIELVDRVYKQFGFPYHVELSTKPENSMGAQQDWDMAERALAEVLTELNMDYVVNEGDGAFYGPKIDFHLEDAIGRTWQCATIQLDFQMPERFDLEYVGEDNERHRPIMIHRVVFGAIERFMAVLTEHYAGAFPLWLAPEQVRVLPISDRLHGYAREVTNELIGAGLRASMDERNEKIGYKIREAQVMKVPYMLVVGDKEAESGTVSVRAHGEEDTSVMPLGGFIALAVDRKVNRK